MRSPEGFLSGEARWKTYSRAGMGSLFCLVHEYLWDVGLREQSDFYTEEFITAAPSPPPSLLLS